MPGLNKAANAIVVDEPSFAVQSGTVMDCNDLVQKLLLDGAFSFVDVEIVKIMMLMTALVAAGNYSYPPVLVPNPRCSSWRAFFFILPHSNLCLI